MFVHGITPILNVTDIPSSIAWFEIWGWRKLWDWGTPPSFACVGVGNTHLQIFLCHNGQGGRGKGSNITTFGTEEGDRADKGVWMSVFVDDVDAVFRVCLEAALDITHTPEDMPWNTREMHLRHTDGHVFRISGEVKSAIQTP